MADDVEDWKKQSNELEQIQVDLKSNVAELEDKKIEANKDLETAHNIADDLQGLAESSLPQGDPAESSLPQGDLPESSLPQGDLPEGSIPQGDLPEGQLPQGTALPSSEERLGFAQDLARSIQDMPGPDESVGSDALNQQSGEILEPSQQAVQNMGIPQGEAQGVQDTLTDTIQAGSDVQAAQQQANEAARNLAEGVARLNSSPSGDPPLGGANQAAPSPGSGNQVAPPNNGTGTTPTTPSVSANPVLSDLANQFQAARDEEQRRIADAQQQSQELASALERALQPAAGTQTNPADAANQGASANGIQPKGTQPGTSANLRPSGGGSGLGAAGLAASRLGAPYAMGAEGPGAYSCTGLMRAIARDMGWPEPSWNPDDYRGYTPAGGPVPGSVATFPGGVGMVGADGNIIHANHATGSVTSLPPDVLGVDGYYIPPGWSV
jgi:hypothetical protein